MAGARNTANAVFEKADLMRAIVTGGAGFIGSHICGRLKAGGADVVSIDRLPTPAAATGTCRFAKKDLAKDDVSEELRGADAVFHYAANPDVRQGLSNPDGCFADNVIATCRLLEACRRADVRRLVFASTSAVYGNARVLPTPEEHPCAPISAYGASKLAGEAYCSAYSSTYGIKATVLRYANVYGPGSTHGVMHDFFAKLRKNPERLEVLGNGKQKKSYIYISDALDATMAAFEKQEGMLGVFNIGSRKSASVDDIAGMVGRRMGANPVLAHTGSGAGWLGDVPEMLLSTEKIEKLGWKEKTGIEEGIAAYVDYLALKNGGK